MRLLRVAPLALSIAIPAVAQQPALAPREFTVPWGASTRPRDPVADNAGRVWFVGQQGNYVAYLTPATGEFKQFAIDRGTHPHNITVDERGGVWFTGNRNGRLYQINPENGEIKTIVLDSAVRDPHTMIWGKNGVAWFTAQGANYVGRFERSSGRVRLWKMSPNNARPYGIVVDSKGQPWFDLFGTNAIGTIDLATMEVKRYPLPHERARPRRIAVTSDDAVWYGDYSRGFVGRLDPKTGRVEEWPLPSGGISLPYAMALDDKDRVWLAETGVNPNRLVAFDTKARQFVANIPVPSDGARANTIRHMTFHAPSREIWFGTDAGTIGSVKVPPELRALVP